MNQNTYINVKMTKQEAIKYYANKIVEDSIEDCMELNYCMTNEYYEDNGFVKENQDEILEEIKKDERIADVYLNKSSKPYTFDMVFWSDYCPGYYEDYTMSMFIQNDIIKDFIDQLIKIKDNSIFIHNTTTQNIINKLLTANNFIVSLSEEEKEGANNMLKEFICGTGFFYKYLDKDKVVVNKENIAELITELQEKYYQLEIYKDSKHIKDISSEDIDEMLKIYEKDKIYPEKYIGLFICKDDKTKTYLAIDNRNGDMYIEEFKTEKECMDYLLGEEDQEEEDEL